jgi:hypothetical protein
MNLAEIVGRELWAQPVTTATGSREKHAGLAVPIRFEPPTELRTSISSWGFCTSYCPHELQFIVGSFEPAGHLSQIEIMEIEPAGSFRRIITVDLLPPGLPFDAREGNIIRLPPGAVQLFADAKGEVRSWYSPIPIRNPHHPVPGWAARWYRYDNMPEQMGPTSVLFLDQAGRIAGCQAFGLDPGQAPEDFTWWVFDGPAPE